MSLLTNQMSTCPSRHNLVPTCASQVHCRHLRRRRRRCSQHQTAYEAALTLTRGRWEVKEAQHGAYMETLTQAGCQHLGLNPKAHAKSVCVARHSHLLAA